MKTILLAAALLGLSVAPITAKPRAPDPTNVSNIRLDIDAYCVLELRDRLEFMGDCTLGEYWNKQEVIFPGFAGLNLTLVANRKLGGSDVYWHNGVEDKPSTARLESNAPCLIGRDVMLCLFRKKDGERPARLQAPTRAYKPRPEQPAREVTSVLNGTCHFELDRVTMFSGRCQVITRGPVGIVLPMDPETTRTVTAVKLVFPDDSDATAHAFWTTEHMDPKASFVPLGVLARDRFVKGKKCWNNERMYLCMQDLKVQ